MRIKLDSAYQSATGQDEEITFSGYNLEITSAFYPSSTLAYAVAIDMNDSMTYILSYDWNSANKAPTLYPMKGLTQDPNLASPIGIPHVNSIIFAENSDSSDFPVKGYIVGGTKSLWSYSSCVAPDFGFLTPSYSQIFTSPNANAKVGYIQKIHADSDSCSK